MFVLSGRRGLTSIRAAADTDCIESTRVGSATAGICECKVRQRRADTRTIAVPGLWPAYYVFEKGRRRG